jgi:CheY-like chemotaxis protein
MLQVQARQDTAAGVTAQAAPRAGAAPAPGDQQPLRFLLLRQKPGELPWLVRALLRYMAPAQVVPVVGMSSALWRLSRERFDAVLLDVQIPDRAVLERCREHIADVAAVPVLHLYDIAGEKSEAEQRARPRREPRKAPGFSDRHEVARLPWGRRAKHEARKAERATFP